MKVLLVNGSPHKEGCTYTALAEVEKSLNEENIDTEIFWIGIKQVGGCISCGSCRGAGECIYDDVVNECRPKAMGADGFIFGTPVHYASVSGSMTGFMDRLFYSDLLGPEKSTFTFKPAAAVVSARRAGTTATFDQMIKYFTINQMPVVSASYWNMVHGAKPEEVLQDAEGMFTMRELGKNMAYLLQCLEAGKKAGIRHTVMEEKPFTNFIR
ncbi:MAG: flavodoxin family protein [Clostridiales bacterium]|jgi:multimeric flavodoxin WrbA|nr:flavodoxin family protein [Clostridiales bacterium]